jgi:hypothetical protein
MDLLPTVAAAREELLKTFGEEREIKGGMPTGPGWALLLLSLFQIRQHIRKTYGMIIKVAQIKEKFGGLRFYLDGFEVDGDAMVQEEDGSCTWVKNSGTVMRQPYKNFDVHREYAEFRGAIRMAEYMAAKTCEVCGRYGERRSGGWVHTLCDGCWEEDKAEQGFVSDEQYQRECKEAAGAHSDDQ